ncbi:PAS domain S-box protein [Candidatus Omnitrophota bacterium]
MIYLVVSNLITLLIAFYLIKKCCNYRYGHRTFHQLIDHINVGYYRYRCRDGVILAASKGFVNILELDMRPKEVIGRSLSELLIYVDEEESIRAQLRIKKELRNHEYRFKTLRGKDKCVLHNSYIEKDPYSREEIIEALIEDVTEERLSYEKMKESQERYEELFKSSGDMVIICAVDDFVIEEVNPVTEVITGFSENELVGMPFENLFHPSSRKSLEEAQKDLLFTGSARLEAVAVCENGTYKEVILTLSLVEIKDHRIAMAVIKDVSAMVKEREEQSRRKKELEDFWKASVEREERIKDLRLELERAKQKIKLMKEKHGSWESGNEE